MDVVVEDDVRGNSFSETILDAGALTAAVDHWDPATGTARKIGVSIAVKEAVRI